MLSIEKKLVDWLVERKNIVFFIFMSVIGLLIRYVGRNFISHDMEIFLIPWFKTFDGQGGFDRLGNQVGNYNILYQTIIVIFSYLDIDCVYLYKGLSVIFDYLLAFSGAYIVCKLVGRDYKKDSLFMFIYSVILFTPTVFLNSAFWGQCDSIYVTFVIWVIYLLYVGKNKRAFIMLGFGFAFKLQTVFILPFIAILYIVNRRFSILDGIFSVASFWLSGIAGYVCGRDLLDAFRIYINQTGEYRLMHMNTPSFWCMFGQDYDDLSEVAIILTIAILAMGLFLILYKKIDLDNNEKYISLAIWTVWTMLLFLPAMHERYTYMLDILLIMIVFINKRYILFAFVEIMLSVIAYNNFLFEGIYEVEKLSGLNLILWVVFFIKVFDIGIIRALLGISKEHCTEKNEQ